MDRFEEKLDPRAGLRSDTMPENGTTASKVTKHPSPTNPSKKHILPTFHREGRLQTKYINPEGESGRCGFHPWHFLRVIGRSASKMNMIINILWPFVPAAFALYWALPERYIAIFAVAYIAMIPAAGLLGFAGQEFARKLPRVAGIMTETLLTGVVEIVLFIILIVKDGSEGHEGEIRNYIPVIQAAILGSILANLLLCLGACFFVGGIKFKEQSFHGVVSEVGSGILLVAGFGLLIPSAFYTALNGHTSEFVAASNYSLAKLDKDTITISRVTAIILMVAFFLYIGYSAFSHDSLFDEVLAADEEIDRDRHKDLEKSKLTMFEAVFAIVFSLACISLLAYILVAEIEPIVVNSHVPDNFMGLILVPLVEKIAEHLTAVDEAYDNQINFALFHCLGPSVQTALFNGPLVVIVAWGLGKDMDLNFEIFMVVLLVLAILVVGNFLRDGSSNWLEGALLIIVYVIIAVTTVFYPNASDASTNSSALGGSSGSAHGGEAHAAEALALAKRLIESGWRPREL